MPPLRETFPCRHHSCGGRRPQAPRLFWPTRSPPPQGSHGQAATQMRGQGPPTQGARHGD